MGPGSRLGRHLLFHEELLSKRKMVKYLKESGPLTGEMAQWVKCLRTRIAFPAPK